MSLWAAMSSGQQIDVEIIKRGYLKYKIATSPGTTGTLGSSQQVIWVGMIYCIYTSAFYTYTYTGIYMYLLVFAYRVCVVYKFELAVCVCVCVHK